MSALRRAAAALAAVATVAALAASPAAAEQRIASAGQTTATLSYTRSDDHGLPPVTGLRLTVLRAGQPAYDQAVATEDCPPQACVPLTTDDAGPADDASLQVVDLDGDGEPEVLVDLYTGGAHCCVVGLVLRWQGTEYAASERNWGDAGYRLEDLDGDAVPEFRTGDPRFAYAFASFADSAFPVRVLRFGAGAWTDVSATLPAVLRADARHWLDAYRQRRRGTRALGLLAAWAADEYRLGHRAAVRRFLQRELRAGRLRGDAPWPRRTAFVRTLDRRLRAWGYVR